MIGLPQCVGCVHYHFKSWTCDAFPKGIPEAIIDGDFDHNKPYKGDKGIRFEARK